MIEMCTDIHLSFVMSNINNWVDVDKSVAGYKILNDDEIAEAVHKGHMLTSEEDNDEEIS